jgi:hypothetical protein
MGHAVDHHGAAVPGEADALRADARGAGRLDDIVVAALRLLIELAHALLRAVALDQHGGVDPERLGPLELIPAGRGHGHVRRPAGREQLREQQARRAGSQHQRSASRLRAQGLEAVQRAGRRLGEHGNVGIEPFDVEDRVGRDRHELGEAAVAVGADAGQIATQELPAAATLVAAPAAHVRVDGDPPTRGELGHPVAGRLDRADDLVAGDEREPRREVALVDVLVRPAESRLVDPDLDVVRPGIGRADVLDGECPWRGVLDGFHGLSPVAREFERWTVVAKTKKFKANRK